MSIALNRDLEDYEGNHVYNDVLLNHIEHCKLKLNECSALKRFNASYTKSNEILETKFETSSLQPKSFSEKMLRFFRRTLGINSIKHDKDLTNKLEAIPTPTKLTSQLQFLFSLNVCSDQLLQLIDQDKLTVDEYVQFFEAIGMNILESTIEYYHPFYYEIYRVEDEIKTGNNFEICLASQQYPAIFFGELIFVRAGVTIFNHPNINKTLAEQSTIYFTNWRDNRPCQDLSHGWGSNSRWRTDFVRNYDTTDYWRFNVDGDLDLADMKAYQLSVDFIEDALPLAVAKEVLVNRHALTLSETNISELNDLFPYDWKLNIAKADFDYTQWQ